jgi:hypothetical protein
MVNWYVPIAMSAVASAAIAQPAVTQASNAVSERDRAAILRLYELERDALLRRDYDALEKFYPKDFVVTNPFGQYINRSKVFERMRGDIIKYSRYDRTFDDFRRYGNTVTVIGSETVVPTQDAARHDAGQIVRRRFTEVWLWRDRRWQKIIRHASDMPK